jgi:hypothetical protein
MKLLEELTQTMKTPSLFHLFLIFVFVGYILLDFHLPDNMNKVIHSTFGNVLVVILILSLFSTKNPIVVILGIIFGYELLRRSDSVILSSVSKTVKNIPNILKFPSSNKSLEEEMVNDIVPLTSGNLSNQRFTNVSSPTHNASSLTEELTLRV